MGLAERLAEPEVHHNAGCGVGLLLQKLPDEDVTVLRDALDNPDIGHSTIARALQAEGHQSAKGTVGKHRRGECKCADAGLV